jgi:DUF4097 and DUF4098 domain-containing protein YvlB
MEHIRRKARIFICEQGRGLVGRSRLKRIREKFDAQGDLCAMERTTMRLTKRSLWTASIALAGIAVTLAAAPARADDWKKTYQVSGRASLYVSTGDGDVTITGGDQKQIDAEVTSEGIKIGPNDVQVVETQTGDHVSIEIKFPHMSWHMFSGHRSLRVNVRVPRDADIDARTGDGNIEATNLTGKLQFDSGDGNVNANNIHGDIRMHTGDGRIEGRGFDGSLDANTGDGSMRVEGRFDALALKTGDGSIDAQIGNGSKVASQWNVHSGDGSITLRLPADLNANLEARTGDGNINMDYPIMMSGTLSHASVHGKLNAGGGTLSISSGDGSIHISKL